MTAGGVVATAILCLVLDEEVLSVAPWVFCGGAVVHAAITLRLPTVRPFAASALLVTTLAAYAALLSMVLRDIACGVALVASWIGGTVGRALFRRCPARLACLRFSEPAHAILATSLTAIVLGAWLLRPHWGPSVQLERAMYEEVNVLDSSEVDRAGLMPGLRVCVPLDPRGPAHGAVCAHCIGLYEWGRPPACFALVPPSVEDVEVHGPWSHRTWEPETSVTWLRTPRGERVIEVGDGRGWYSVSGSRQLSGRAWTSLVCLGVRTSWFVLAVVAWLGALALLFARFGRRSVRVALARCLLVAGLTPGVLAALALAIGS